MYEEFLELVMNARPFDTLEEVDQVARGRVWSGSQAAERDLVDQTGSLQNAIDAAARIAGLGDAYPVTWTEQELSTIERLVLEMTSGVMSKLVSQSSTMELVRRSFLQNLLDDLEILTRGQNGLTIAAHCLCGIE